MRLQLLAALLVTCVAFLAVIAHQGWLPLSGLGTSAASLAGLSLAYALPIVGVLDGLLIYSSETEQEMVAVERIEEYLAIKPQVDRSWPWADVSLQEPRMPIIKIQELYLRYKAGLPFALAGLSLSIQEGEKIGVVGRTGAGKSTLVSALLRLVEVDSGSILLRGQDTRSMSLHELRSSFGVVPQSPLILGGATVRDNLDPRGKRSNEELVDALKSVQLWKHLSSFVKKASGPKKEPSPSPVPSSASIAPLSPQGGSSSELSAEVRGGSGSSLVSLRDLDPTSSRPFTLPAAGRDFTLPAAGRDFTLSAAGRDEGEGRVGELLGVSPDSIKEVGRRSKGKASSSWDLWTRPWGREGVEASLRAPLLLNEEAGGQLRLEVREPMEMGDALSVLSLKIRGEGAAASDGDDGRWVGLSHGQKQLLCLARMLLKKSPIVLLDEISAAVDPSTAHLIHQVLDSELKTQGTTVIQIAHDLSVLDKSSDRIVLIENGAVAESGSASLLLQTPGSKLSTLAANAR